MFRLTAKFTIPISNGVLLVYRDLTEELTYRASIDGFGVEVCLNPDFKAYLNLSQQSKKELNQAPYFGLTKVIIFVVGEEEMEPPLIPPANHEERWHYFEERKPKYRTVAWTILDRTINYFKYNLQNPLLVTPSQYSQYLQNPNWIDNTGQELKAGGFTAVANRLPEPGLFGVKGLSANEDQDFEKALIRPVEPKLHEELLSDAQTAIFQGNLRRGALEVAIACETAVKQIFFATSNNAGAAYEYLESKRKISVSIPELIDGAAKQAFGKSFKTINPKAFDSINYLFRCRNKIAHRGEAWYTDNRGNRHELDRDILATWWGAVVLLLEWLELESNRA